MAFKKDLTSIGGKRGRVVTNRGKGAAVPDRGDPMARALGRYPAQPQPVPNPTMAPAVVGGPPPAGPPVGMGPNPTAAMPSNTLPDV